MSKIKQILNVIIKDQSYRESTFYGLMLVAVVAMGLLK